MRRALVIAAALALASAAAAQEGVRVAPVIVEIDAARGVGSFRMHNGGPRAVAFEIDAFVWDQVNGANALAPTDRLIVAPSVFRLEPGAAQIVRLGLQPANANPAREEAFRILVRELPDPEASASGVRLRTEMSMPVFVTPRGAQARLALSEAQGPDGARRITLTNAGAARAHLSAPDGLSTLPRYLLAGESVTFAAPAADGFFYAAGPGEAEARRISLDDDARDPGARR